MGGGRSVIFTHYTCLVTVIFTYYTCLVTVINIYSYTLHVSDYRNMHKLHVPVYPNMYVRSPCNHTVSALQQETVTHVRYPTVTLV
jgi:hypothetical protein